MPSALRFTSGSSNRVDCGAAASLANFAVGTICMWFYADDVSNSFRCLASKVNSSGIGGWQFNRVGSSGSTLRLFRYRATTDQQVSTPASTIVVGWNYAAGAWDITGSSPLMHHGTIRRPAADVSTTVTAGSGAQSDDTANTMLVGNYGNAATVAAWPGRIPCVALFASRLTAPDARKVQELLRKGATGRLHPRAVRTRLPDRARLLLFFDGTGKQFDWSGNGNHGTVTGATAAPGKSAARRRRRVVYTEQAAASGFKAAWARGSNVMIPAGAA